MRKSDRPATDRDIVNALLDPVNIEIFDFLRRTKPFMIGSIYEHFGQDKVRAAIQQRIISSEDGLARYRQQMISESIEIPKTRSGLMSRLEELERLGFITRLKSGKGKKVQKKNQHTKWQPYYAGYYDKLEEHRMRVIRIIYDVRTLVNISAIVPDAYEISQQIRSTHDNPKNSEKLRAKLRPIVGILLERFSALNSTMRKRSLEWAIQSKYFDDLSYNE